MADKEKPESIHPLTPIIVLVIALALVSAAWVRIKMYIDAHEATSVFFGALWGFLTGDQVYRDQLFQAYPNVAFAAFALKSLSYLVSFVFLIGIIYSIIKLTALNRAWLGPLHLPKGVTPHSVTEEKIVNKKWEKVLDHINSKNPGDWKIAIIEADIILDEMLDKMGYHGDSMGDKLKSVEQSDFTTLNNAWEAHKIRNSIAHQGSDFLLNEREARRVISLYLSVFEEFKYV